MRYILCLLTFGELLVQNSIHSSKWVNEFELHKGEWPKRMNQLMLSLKKVNLTIHLLITLFYK